MTLRVGPLRIGTRGSALALAQTEAVAKSLGGDTELVVITTHGDTATEPLENLGGTGVFAGALREALLRGECDLVVHSLKDLPTAPYPGLSIGAVPRRADSRDALCARDDLKLADLEPGSRVGTGSPRRRAQLLSRRPDLDVVDLRGNVDTRLAHVADGRLDAVVLAVAGLERLGRLGAITDFFGIDPWPTAPGQGALAIEVRDGDAATAKLVAKVNHRVTRLTTSAERAVLAKLEAGCSSPIGAHAVDDNGLLFLSARVYAWDGSSHLTSSHALYTDDSMDPAGDVAARVATELLELGAAELT
ncbi:MAG TPA: hydroxymethylbilane synthase [Pseudolysinimonas sp.]|nr:hydroxymethylbilane synthase [Pseudolysinimonas sp.]